MKIYDNDPRMNLKYSFPLLPLRKNQSWLRFCMLKRHMMDWIASKALLKNIQISDYIPNASKWFIIMSSRSTQFLLPSMTLFRWFIDILMLFFDTLLFSRVVVRNKDFVIPNHLLGISILDCAKALSLSLVISTRKVLGWKFLIENVHFMKRLKSVGSSVN